MPKRFALTCRPGRITDAGPDQWRTGDYVVQRVGDWVYIAGNATDLENLPPDPAVLLPATYKTHTISLRIDPTEIPEEERAKFFTDITAAMSDPNPISRDAVQAQHKELGKYAGDYLRMLIEGTHFIEAGMNADAKATKIRVSMRWVAKADSSLSQQLATPLPTPLPLAGFEHPQAAFSLRRAAVVSEADRQLVNFLLPNMQTDLEERFRFNPQLGEPEREKMRREAQLAGALVKLLVGHDFIQQAALVRYDTTGYPSTGLHVVVGFAGNYTTSTTEPLKAMLGDGKDQWPGDDVKVEYNAGEVHGVALHKITVRSQQGYGSSPTRLNSLFGQPQTYVIGTGPGRIYLSVGQEAEKGLRAVLEAGNTGKAADDESLKLRLSAEQLMKLLSAAGFGGIGNSAEIELSRWRNQDALTMHGRRAPGEWTMDAEMEAGMIRYSGALLQKFATPSQPFTLPRFPLTNPWSLPRTRLGR